MDRGEEKLEDESIIGQLRLQARRINRRAMMLAFVLTIITIAFP